MSKNNNMKIHIIQHVPFEGPGYISDWASQQHISLSFSHVYETGGAFPALDTFDALVVMGGPMGVYDEDEYPWLVQEKALITACIHAGKKVLGICLGAQLIATCLGASVHAAPHKEIGWFPVHTIAQSESIAWLYRLFENSPTVFHWHGDQFDIPAGAVELLTSAANEHQAYLYKTYVLGLQFHLEMTSEGVRDLLSNGAHELKEQPYIQNSKDILADVSYVETTNTIMDQLLTAFFLA